ncbi:FAD-dependent monooxygenase [Jeongeupia wiesaeckerbachi]|uniref:FAD-dependent monooxygenase n=1 Tax=Jeongeupia wiesaeckerbachi TaxID=3051218 RepID=UPI003D801B68
MIAERLPEHVDVAIVGGGPVGALLALRLADAGINALAIEARVTTPADPRALALSHASAEALGRVGLWGDDPSATAITRVHVSQAGTLGRTELSSTEIGLPALGYVVPYRALAGLALDRLKAGKAAVALGTTVTGVDRLARYARLSLATPHGRRQLTASLVVLADGGQLLAGFDDVKQTVKPYAQHAILATITPTEPHLGVAFERFADDGPLALLPNGDDYTLVWTQTPAGAEEKLALSDAEFIAQVSARFAGRIAGFTRVGARAGWPLALKTLDSVVGRRVVMIGNAAQTLHPVAGQGLNLGLRDATTLADLLSITPAAQLGEAATLARYAALRRQDAGRVTRFTDGLIGWFDNPNPLLKHARSAGLLALDQIGPLRRGFARKMVYGAR